MEKSSSSKFKEGGTVQLVSGGPKMTITEVEERSHEGIRYYCKWFAGSKLESAYFKESSLIEPAK